MRGRGRLRGHAGAHAPELRVVLAAALHRGPIRMYGVLSCLFVLVCLLFVSIICLGIVIVSIICVGIIIMIIIIIIIINNNNTYYHYYYHYYYYHYYWRLRVVSAVRRWAARGSASLGSRAVDRGR